jgi:hypothetical protein
MVAGTCGVYLGGIVDYVWVRRGGSGKHKEAEEKIHVGIHL